MNIKKGIAWAGSNIYWNSTQGGLTFEKYGYTGEKKNYQGVFFKWGSLVGISPAQTLSPFTATMQDSIYGGTDGDSDGTPVYVYNGTQWIQTNVATASHNSLTSGGFTALVDNRMGSNVWTCIPYVNDNISADRFLNHLQTLTDNKGDICQYLGTIDSNLDGYRMPVSNEFEAEADWKRGNLVAGTGDVYGATPINSGHTHSGIMFPASGYRDMSSGRLVNIGTYGEYWSGSSAGSTEYAYRLVFYGYQLAPGNSNYRTYGHPVRCVLDD
jgi:hypothetical protein